jgi:hypothetical protein
MLRTEADFILASNLSYDLAGLVVTYLNLYRKYINGFNSVTVPDKEFAVTVRPPTKEGFLTAVLHWTDYTTHTKTLYYDTDSDYFSEQWGADNSCGETSYREDYAESSGISIPIKHLMMPESDMIKYFQEKKVSVETIKKENVRQEQIAELKSKIQKLESEQ